MDSEHKRIFDYIRQRLNFVTGVSSGIGVSSEVFVNYNFSPYFRDPQEDMRSDWMRIGDDFKVVIFREHIKTTSDNAGPQSNHHRARSSSTLAHSGASAHNNNHNNSRHAVK